MNCSTADDGQRLTRLAIGGAEARFQSSGAQSYVLINTQYNDLDAVVQAESLRYESPSVIVGERTDYFSDLNCSVTNLYRMELVRTYEEGSGPGQTCNVIATQTVSLRSGPGPNTDSAGQFQSGQSLRVGRQTRGDDGFSLPKMEHGCVQTSSLRCRYVRIFQISLTCCSGQMPPSR
jgi:hypothetical protein